MAFIKKNNMDGFERCSDRQCSEHGIFLVDELKLFCNHHFYLKYKKEINESMRIQMAIFIKISKIMKRQK